MNTDATRLPDAAIATAARPRLPWVTLVLFAALFPCASGCNSLLSNLSTRPHIRAGANTLAQRVGEYSDQQRQRVERINETTGSRPPG